MYYELPKQNFFVYPCALANQTINNLPIAGNSVALNHGVNGFRRVGMQHLMGSGWSVTAYRKCQLPQLPRVSLGRWCGHMEWALCGY